MREFKYKAFISYSHKDKHWARWLHRRLEAYAFPTHAIGQRTDFGPVPKNLKPIFRDRDELAAAGDLGEKIEDALSQSENLIIICSNAAATSHWVNQEILYFKKHNRGAKIFSVIVEGEPFTTGMPGRAAEECLPPALRFQVDEAGELTDTPAEPLAADLRPQGDGKRLGLLKLISGMAGLGLDDLVQRDLQRARRRVTAITVGAISAMLVMGSLTWLALDARQEAETRRAEAEARTESAEELIEFMVTDLKEKLEPVGRLEALKVVGEQASQYYDQYPLTAHDDDALGRRARVFHYLGDIQNKLGNLEEADSYFQRAYASTRDLLARDPKNADRIFDHSQSAYWAGHVPYMRQQYDIARPFFSEYIRQAESLDTVEPNTLRSLKEKTYAYTNMGIVLSKQRQYGEAKLFYLKALPDYIALTQNFPKNAGHILDLGNAYAWLSDNEIKLSNFEAALIYRKEQLRIIEEAKTMSPDDLKIEGMRLFAVVGLAQAEYLAGAIDDATKRVNIGIFDSYDLWSQDKDNMKYFENVALFELISAELAFQNSAFLTSHNAVKNYDKLRKDALLQNRQMNFFFSEHDHRRDKIVLYLAKMKIGKSGDFNEKVASKHR